MKKKCGNCKHSKFNWMYKEYICMNDDSDNKDLPTDFAEVCECWEEKDE